MYAEVMPLMHMPLWEGRRVHGGNWKERVPVFPASLDEFGLREKVYVRRCCRPVRICPRAPAAATCVVSNCLAALPNTCRKERHELASKSTWAEPEAAFIRGWCKA